MGNSEAPTRTSHSAPPPATLEAPPTRADEGLGDAATPTVGAVVDRYTILERIGAGGMGEVYAAYDGKLDRKVALKLLRHKNEEYEARLMREAQAMARLSHPNVVAVFDTGYVDGKLYLAMEFVRGQTLRAWQKGATRALGEVLRVYAEAGHGLAAAHAAGLVHRDFKPDNVLVAEDGRIKVTDFGIARALDERSAAVSKAHADLGAAPLPAAEGTEGSLAPAAASATASTLPSSGSLDNPVTAEGTLLGTPGYMAPEQFLCEAVDARTDQFAFCVSLYEALYDQKPFGAPRTPGKRPTLEEVAQATLEGKIHEPAKGSSVPAHVRRALLRGLSSEAPARYPSMQELLADLAKDPAQKRRRTAGVAASIFALCTLTAVGVRATNAQRAALCAATESEAAEAWNPATQASAERALLATGLPYAADTWARTKAEIDGYMQRWKDMHKQTCEATRLHGHQTEAVMTLRMSCLDQRRSEVKALANVLATADKDVTAKALQAAMSLTSVDACKDVASLTAVAPEPTDPNKRAELKRIREGLASTRENIDAGRYAAARDEAMALVPRAREAGYAPVLAEALLLCAQAKASAGKARDESIREALEATKRADEGRADATRASAATWLTLWLMQAANLPEAERWAEIADGVLRREGDRGALRAEWLRIAGRLSLQEGRHDEAAARFREGLRIGREARLGTEAIVEIQRSLAGAEGKLGENEAAERDITEAEDLVRRTMGPEHPVHLRVMLAHGFVAGTRGDKRGAIRHWSDAIALGERVAPEDEAVAIAAANACGSISEMGNAEAALPLCEKALGRMRVLYPDGLNLAYLQNNIGDALNHLHRYAEAVPHLEASRAIHEKAGALEEANYFNVLSGLGEANLGLGQPKVAIGFLDRALAFADKTAQPSADYRFNFARTRFLLARARWENGAREAKTLALADEALGTIRELGREEVVPEFGNWLATRAK